MLRTEHSTGQRQLQDLPQRLAQRLLVPSGHRAQRHCGGLFAQRRQQRAVRDVPEERVLQQRHRAERAARQRQQQQQRAVEALLRRLQLRQLQLVEGRQQRRQQPRALQHELRDASLCVVRHAQQQQRRRGGGAGRFRRRHVARQQGQQRG